MKTSQSKGRSRPQLSALAIAILISFLLFGGTVLALSLGERRPGVWGKVTGGDGEPLRGVVITLAPANDREHPVRVKTTRKGDFALPRVEFFKDGYYIGVESEEYFIREFSFKVRRINGEIWQEVSGKLSPKDQERLPVLEYRGGNATIKFTLLPLDDFQAQAEQAERARAEQALAAAKQKKRAEMTTVDLAEEALGVGDFATAIERFEQAIEEDPQDSDLKWRYAEALAQSGDRAAALRAGRKAIDQAPEVTGRRMKMADWMDRRGQLAGAVPLLEAERGLRPQDAAVLSALVRAYEEAGMTEKADATLEQWVEVAPKDPQALMALAASKSRRGQHEEAEQIFRRIAQLDPDNAHLAFFNAGASIINKSGAASQADRERAVAAFGKALEFKPDYARAHLLLGDTLLGLGKLAEAKQHYQKFLELAPEDPQAAKIKGIVAALP